jgi:hypothetical protein
MEQSSIFYALVQAVWKFQLVRTTWVLDLKVTMSQQSIPFAVW